MHDHTIELAYAGDCLANPQASLSTARQLPARPRIPWRLLAMLQGAIAGLAIVLVAAVVIDIVPMLASRHAAMTSEVSPSHGATARYATARTPDCPLPPISWNLIGDDADRLARRSLTADIAAMRDEDGLGPIDGLILPVPVMGENAEESRRHVMRLVNEVYGDEPELSVYTDGECCHVSGALARYVFDESSQGTPEQSMREYDEARSRLDAVARELAEETDSSERRAMRNTLGADGLYATLAYRWVGTHTTYSDGIDDSLHTNDVYGAMMEGETRCYGAACALKAFLDRGGIPAFVATGDIPGTDRHAWVVARIDGRWVALDGTVAQRLTDEERDDITAAIARMGNWSACMVSLDEYLSGWNIQMDAECEELIREYEQIAEPVEQQHVVQRAPAS